MMSLKFKKKKKIYFVDYFIALKTAVMIFPICQQSPRTLVFDLDRVANIAS